MGKFERNCLVFIAVLCLAVYMIKTTINKNNEIYDTAKIIKSPTN